MYLTLENVFHIHRYCKITDINTHAVTLSFGYLITETLTVYFNFKNLSSVVHAEVLPHLFLYTIASRLLFVIANTSPTKTASSRFSFNIGSPLVKD